MSGIIRKGTLIKAPCKRYKHVAALRSALSLTNTFSRGLSEGWMRGVKSGRMYEAIKIESIIYIYSRMNVSRVTWQSLFMHMLLSFEEERKS